MRHSGAVCSHTCPRRRDAKQTKATRYPRNRCLDAAGRTPGQLSSSNADGSCGRSRSRSVPVLPGVPGDHTHFLVRGFENRRLQPQEDAQGHLLEEVRSWPTIANRPLQVPARHGRTARSTVVQLAFGQLTILPPRFETRCGKEPLSLWAIHVWEEDIPDGEEPLE